MRYHPPSVTQICLVSNEDDDDITSSHRPHIFKPFAGVLKGLFACNSRPARPSRPQAQFPPAKHPHHQQVQTSTCQVARRSRRCGATIAMSYVGPTLVTTFGSATCSQPSNGAPPPKHKKKRTQLEHTCDVIDDHSDGRVSDVARDEGSESFLACSVPKLQAHCPIIQVQGLAEEVNTNGGLRTHTVGPFPVTSTAPSPDTCTCTFTETCTCTFTETCTCTFTSHDEDTHAHTCTRSVCARLHHDATAREYEDDVCGHSCVSHMIL